MAYKKDGIDVQIAAINIESRAEDIESFSQSILWQDIHNYIEHEIREIENIGYSKEATQTNIIQGTGIIVGLRSAQNILDSLIIAANNREIDVDKLKKDGENYDS